MYFTKENLDTPISMIEEGATNTQTPREFIRSSEEEFGLEHLNIDGLTEEDINDYIDLLDYLWTK